LNTNSESLLIEGVFVYDSTNPAGDNIGDVCDPDIDNDMLDNGLEAVTSPVNPDSDADTYIDGAEAACGSNPLDSASTPIDSSGTPDVDNDRLPDSCETAFGATVGLPDSDADGLLDGLEATRKQMSPASGDSDSDGCADEVELASVDSNQVVTAADLGIVAHNTVLGNHAGVIPRADMDGNGVVTAADLGIIAANLGARCF
jgi:hypothetical protein